MDLPIGPHEPAGADDRAGVVELPAVLLQEAEDAAAAGRPGDLGDRGHLRALDGDRVGVPVVPALEAVARERALGEDRQLRPFVRGVLEAGDDPLEVAAHLAEHRLHLHRRHPDRRT